MSTKRLAADLDLPLPEPLLVDFDAEFVELMRARDPSAAERAAQSIPVAFGSSKLPPGFTILPRDKAIPQAVRSQAAEILAFDALIQNPDRRVENPNCLFNGRDFAIFDHELAFMTQGIIGWRPPWQPGGLDWIKGPVPHVFYNELQGKASDLTRFKGAWLALSDQRLQAYRQALPPAWANDGGVANEALGYIAQVRDNIDSALAEVGRVLR